MPRPREVVGYQMEMGETKPKICRTIKVGTEVWVLFAQKGGFVQEPFTARQKGTKVGERDVWVLADKQKMIIHWDQYNGEFGEGTVFVIKGRQPR